MTRTFHELIINAADATPEKTAVIHNYNGISYQQIFDESNSLASSLATLGVKKGDRVCCYLEKRFEKIISLFGISMAGGILVPISKLLHLHQTIYILNDCRAEILITTSSRAEVLHEHIQQLPYLKTIISLEKIRADRALQGVINYIEWGDILAASKHSYSAPSVSQLDLAAILYTSGSTGMPKGVVLNHRNIVEGAKIVAGYLKINQDDRLLSILTFSFDYGLNQLTTTFLKCAQLVLFDYLFPKDILKTVERHRITGLAAVATTWNQLLQTSWGNSMNSLRYVTNSGGSIPVNLVKKLRERIPNTDIYLMYGLTEAFRSTYLEPSMVDLRPGSIGKAVPGEEIFILNTDDQPVQPGEIGELVHRGTLVAQGYWGDPELTRTRFRFNPFQVPDVPLKETVVYTGDYGQMDKDGYLYFVGRKDEMIKSAGNRISPTEVEEIIYHSGLVSDVISFGIPHQIYGQSVFVVASPLDDNQLELEDLLQYCRKMMPQYMIPSDVYIWDVLPKNKNGKIDRSLIKKEIFKKLGIQKTISG